MRLFVGGKWASQVANQIPSIFGQVLHAHLLKVRASLFVELHGETKYFFTGQRDCMLRLFWMASIFSVCEVPVRAALPLDESWGIRRPTS